MQSANGTVVFTMKTTNDDDTDDGDDKIYLRTQAFVVAVGIVSLH